MRTKSTRHIFSVYATRSVSSSSIVSSTLALRELESLLSVPVFPFIEFSRFLSASCTPPLTDLLFDRMRSFPAGAFFQSRGQNFGPQPSSLKFNFNYTRSLANLRLHDSFLRYHCTRWVSFAVHTNRFSPIRLIFPNDVHRYPYNEVVQFDAQPCLWNTKTFEIRDISRYSLTQKRPE